MDESAVAQKANDFLGSRTYGIALMGRAYSRAVFGRLATRTTQHSLLNCLAFGGECARKADVNYARFTALPKPKGNPERKRLSMNDTANTAGATAMGLGTMLLLLLIALALYVFICFCLKRICEKCGVNPGVLIWIPIAQLIPLLQVAKMPVWVIILFLIPVVSLIVCIFMWVKICIARGKSGWLVILLFIPVLNLIFIPYLAFSE
jgi:hypothetical protein